MITEHTRYMLRCIELAKKGAGFVAPNPMVGAVLVYNYNIIGEGYHQQFGQAHAEVNCINSVIDEDKPLIENSTLYVSLEPCAHVGKTPPCTDLIIHHKIPKVVIGCKDPFEEVDGKGIEKLKNVGIEVIVGIAEKEAIDLNKRFFTFHKKKRPFIILKWAQSSNHKIAHADYSRVQITNDYTNRLVHRWRSEEAAIMVGTNTALYDNPALNVRHWTGKNPVRLVVDMNLRLPHDLKIFDRQQATVIFNSIKHEEEENLLFYKIEKPDSLVDEIMKVCYEMHIQSILIEGGNKLSESFINEGAWDEGRVIENTSMIINNGLNAPVLTNHHLTKTETISTDLISYYQNNLANSY